MDNDTIYRQDAIEALWKALYEYEDKTEKQFIESDELDVGDWILHREFVQNMSDIDRQTILDLPPAQPTLNGYDIRHLMLIADILRRENLPPERVVECITDIEGIVAIVRDAFEESLRKAVGQCKI